MNKVITTLAIAASIAAGGYATGRMHERALQAEHRVAAGVALGQRHDDAVDAGRIVETRTADNTRRVDGHFFGLKREAQHAFNTDAGGGGCGLDARRLRLWTAANDGPALAAASALDDAGRSTPAPGQRSAGRSVRESSRIDVGVLAHEGELPGADRMVGDNR